MSATLSLKRPYVRVMVPMQCTKRSGPTISVFVEMTSRTEKQVSVRIRIESLSIASAIICVLVLGWDLQYLRWSVHIDWELGPAFPLLQFPEKRGSILLKDKANCRRNFWMEGSYRPPRRPSVVCL